MSHATDWSDVTATIAAAEATGATLGVAAVLPGGARFAHNGTRRFIAASTVKIPIMIELFRQIDTGAATLDTPHRLLPQEQATGSGVLAQMHAGLDLTLSDLVFLMIAISDNSATNILIDRVGMAAVNATMAALGMAGSTLGRRMSGVLADVPTLENWAVPDDYARVIETLLNGTAASAASCARMLTLLEAQQNERRIARFLPRQDRPRWGSKTGSLAGVCNDVGFVMTAAGPVVIAVFCADPADPHEGERIIGEVARAVLGTATAGS